MNFQHESSVGETHEKQSINVEKMLAWRSVPAAGGWDIKYV